VSQLKWPRSCMWVLLAAGRHHVAVSDVNLIEAFAINLTTIRDSELQLNKVALASSASASPSRKEDR
jgi:hypothetical protein